MTGKQQITCIICPLSCAITVTAGRSGPEVSGHECKQGERYALQEAADPRRILTGTVRVSGGFLPRLPVKTTEPIPRGLIPKAARLLDTITATAPIRCGDLVAANFADSGADLVATRDLKI